MNRIRIDRLVLFTGLLLLAGCQSEPEAMQVVDIDGKWSFRQVGTDEWSPATVPGTVHTDLLANGKIEDPFYRTNEKELQWIDKEDWEYRCRFSVGPEMAEFGRWRLELPGIDTYADVYVNDSLVLQADNFFRQWAVDVEGLLRPDSNELRIYFHSPVKVGLGKLQAHGYPLPASNDQSENGGLGDQKVSIFTRKPGYHYGWDWGPRLVTSGIWQPVRLVGWKKVRLDDLFFRQVSLSMARADLLAQFTVETAVETDARLQVYHGDTLLAEKKVHLRPGLTIDTLGFQLLDPKLWWTHDLGEPHLYPLRGVVMIGRQPADEATKEIGLRTVHVVQRPDPQGSSFYVELNGVPVYCRGANYIPNDVFIPRVSDERYRETVQAAVDANMNMLRVWGGGFYEKDLFYELCDREGLLVWQDFMFACSMYPGDEAFLQNVRQEAIDNIRRLRNHPCIALWCGNNENDVAWANYAEGSGWGWKEQYTPEQRAEIWADYEAVFHRLLPGLVREYHSGMYYLPTSPFAGKEQHATYTSTSGDMHYWGVWQGLHGFEGFQQYIGRFMSEYGFQSFPDLETVKSFTLPEDRRIDSEVMAAHQRSGIGNERIRQFLERYYTVPEDFEDLLYLSQVQQADAIKVAIEAHRTAKPYCMGSLYWQLNDCWPAASWSGIDYRGRWKALHYEVARSFEPVALIAQFADDSLKVQAVADVPMPDSVILRLRIMGLDGRVLNSWKSNPTWLTTTEPHLFGHWPILIRTRGEPPTRVLIAARLERMDETPISERVVYLAPLDQLELRPVTINPLIFERDGEPWIRLEADYLAKDLYLDFPGVAGRFSDNYFDLVPGIEKWVRFLPAEGAAMPPIEQLQIRTLGDVMPPAN